VLRSRERRIYADPARVHRVAHHGKYYQVDGYHLSEPSPQRTPVLYQAGASSRGQQFAASHAECVFISSQTRDAARALVTALRDQAERSGRRRDDLRIFMGVTVVVAPTEAEAQEKYREYCRYANPEAGLAHFASGTGFDFSTFDPDAPIRPADSNAIQSAVKAVTAKEAGWTVRKLLDQLALGGRYATIVGSPVQVADQLEAWVRETDIDGFNLARTVTPESFEDFVDLVIPELQSRGSFKHEYAEGTLREKLFAASAARLAQWHPAARYRMRHAEAA
jgi:FMN-dependent oxidoreductase (nitrilotriacetate monooxygenase family)